MVLCKPDVSLDEMKQQIESSLDRLNASLTEYELALPDLSTYAERQFFRDDFLNPMAICIFLGLILLIVPAINVSGLISSQMSRRLSELAVRKAYGASRLTLMSQLLIENLLMAFIGALLGFLLSCLLVPDLGQNGLYHNGLSLVFKQSFSADNFCYRTASGIPCRNKYG